MLNPFAHMTNADATTLTNAGYRLLSSKVLKGQVCRIFVNGHANDRISVIGSTFQTWGKAFQVDGTHYKQGSLAEVLGAIAAFNASR